MTSDAPIRSRSSDRLHRRAFAERLANSVANWKGDRSLVIGLRGEWGSGKTSLVHMTVESIIETDPHFPVLFLSCWEWADHENIATALFSDLASILGFQDKALGRAVTRYAERINAVATATSSARPIVGALGAVLTAAGVAVSFVEQLGSESGLVLAMVGAVAVFASTFREVWGKLSAAWAQPRPTLEALKSDLKQKMTRSGQTVLVVVDDIDRLAPTNVLRVLQVIRANADLPKVVFIVPYDRGVLEKSVEHQIPGEGQSFLERFAPVAFDLPTLQQRDLDALFFEVLDGLRTGPQFRPNWDRTRFEPHYHRYLASYLTTPRRVAQIASTLPVMVDLQTNGSVLEVHLGDLISLEVLRLFEPDLHRRLPSVARALTESAYWNDDTRTEAIRAVDGVLSDAIPDRDRRERASQLIDTLFPAVRWGRQGDGYRGDEPRLLRERRVADPSMFPKYFCLVVPQDILSESDLGKLLEALPKGAPAATEVLIQFVRAGLGGALIDRVRAEPQIISMDYLGDFLAALFDASGRLADRDPAFGYASEMLRAVGLAEELLERIPSESRVAALEVALARSAGADLPVRLLRMQLHRHDIARAPALSPADIQGLLPGVVGRIQRDAESGALLRSEHLGFMLHAWHEWDRVAAKSWFDMMLSQADTLAAILESFRTTTEFITDGGQVRKFSLQSIEGWESLHVLADRAAEFVKVGGLDPESAKTLEEFIGAVDLDKEGAYTRLGRRITADEGVIPDAASQGPA